MRPDWLQIPHLSAVSILDIVLVAVLIYEFLVLIRGTRAVPILVGVGGLALALTYYVMLRQLAVDTSMLVPLYALAGLFVGVIGAIPLVMVRGFPPVVRFSGISFSYNVAYAVFGGLTPIVVSLMMKSDPLAAPLYVAAICVLGALTTLFIKGAPRDRIRDHPMHRSQTRWPTTGPNTPAAACVSRTWSAHL